MTIVYLIFLGLALYWSIRYDGQDNDDAKKQHRYWLLCGMLILMSGLSYGLGGDKWVYMENFEWYDAQPRHMLDETISHILFLGNMPGWTMLNLIIKYLTGSFYVVQFVQALIVNTIFFYIARRWTKRIFLFAFLYFLGGVFFRFNTEVMREAIAIACCLIAWTNAEEKNRIRVVIWLLIALLFHVSAVIFIPFFWMPKIRLRISHLILVQVLAFAIWLFSNMLVGYILPLLNSNLGAFSKKIAYYIMINTTFFGFLRNYLTYLGFPSIILYLGQQLPRTEVEQKAYNQWMFYSIIIGLLAASLSGFTRFANYPRLFNLAILCEVIIAYWHSREHLIIRYTAIAGIIAMNIWYDFTFWPKNKFYYYEFFVPYTSILDESKNLRRRKLAHAEANLEESQSKGIRKISSK